MANGLRKLIRRARRLSPASTRLVRRPLTEQRWGRRFQAEELEERIALADASFVLAAGEYIPYDTDDGVGILYNAGGQDVTVSITDGGDAGDADSITIDLDDAGAVELRTNAALTSGDAATAVITDSASATLTLSTGVASGDMDLTGDGASLAAAADFTYFDGTTDPGTDAAPVAAAAATEAAADIASDSDEGSNLTGSIVLDNDAALSDLLELSVSNAGGGSDASDFAGAITVGDDMLIVTIDGTASTGDWTVAGSITGDVTVGTLDATTNVDITGDLGSGSADTFGVTTGDLAGNITVGGDFHVDADINTAVGAITGDITVTGTMAGDVVADNGLSGDIAADTITGAITVTDGNLSGGISTTGAVGTGNIANVTVDTGGTGSMTSTASIDSAGTLATVTVGGDIAGDITAAGTIAGVESEDGGITVDSVIQAGGTITALTVDSDADGTGDGAGDVAGSVSTTDGNITTTDIGGNVSGTIDADDNMTTITVDGEVSGTISAGGNITGGTVTIGTGVTEDGSITAEGNISDNVTITTGAMAGTISAGGDISGDVTVTSGNLSGTVSATGDIDGAVAVVDGDLSGTVSAVNLAGNITASDNISGALSATGDLDGAVQATTGDITGATISIGVDLDGSITAVAGDITGTAITIGTDLDSSGSINATVGDITATTTLVVGQHVKGDITAGSGIDADINVGGDFGGTITADDGDISDLTVTGTVDASLGNVVIDADGNLTMTAGAIDTSSDGNDILITSDGDMNVTVTGTVIARAGETLSFTADADADNSGDIASISSTGAWTAAGTITVAGENVTSVSSDAALAFTSITAATNVDSVSGVGITGAITATDGKVTLVDANTGNYTGTINANTATSASPLITVIDNEIVYTIESDATAAQAEFDLQVTGAGGTITAASVAVTVLDGSDYDISLKTNNEDGSINDAEFDLTSLTFAAATTSRDLGTVTVDGDVNNITLYSGVTPGSVDNLIIQGNLANTLTTSSINLLAASSFGGAQATAALADTYTLQLGGDDPVATQIDGTFTIPLEAAAGNDVLVAGATANGSFGEDNFSQVLFGEASDSEATVTYTAGAVTGLGGSGGDVTVVADLSDAVDLSDFAGSLTIDGDITAAGSLAVGSPTNLTITGTVDGPLTGDSIGNDLTTGDVNADVTIAGGVGNDLTVGTIGNDATVSVDTVGGATEVDGDIDQGSTLLIGSDSSSGDDTIDDDVTITGDMNGVIIITGDNDETIDIQGSMGSVVAVIGNMGTVQSAGDLGAVGGGSVIAATGQIDTVQSLDGDVNAYVFTGGDGSAMDILADDGAVTGQFAVGMRDGVSQLTIQSGSDQDQVDFDGGAAAVQAAAGAFSGAADAFGDIILGDAGNDDITISNENGTTGADVTGTIYIGGDYTGLIESDSSIADVTVDDDTDMSSLLDDSAVFTALAAGLTDAADLAAEIAILAELNDLDDGDIEQEYGNDGEAVDWTGGTSSGIQAESAGNVLVAGDINIGVEVIDSIGYIVSQNGSVTLTAHAGNAIGSIVASQDIDATIISEGTVATDTIVAGSIANVPDWFTGGILSEVGDIDATISGSATGTLSNGIVVFDGMAIGTVYAPVGSVDVTVNAAGDFGGIQSLGAGSDVVLNVTGDVNMLLLGADADVDANIGGDIIIDGSAGGTVVFAGSTFSNDTLTVSVTGAAVAVVEGTDVTLVNGLADGETLTVTGGVDDLVIDGDWAGDVVVNETGVDDGAVDAIVVNGDVAATATLDAYNFNSLTVLGSTSAAVMDSGTLDSSDRTETFTNVNGDSQTIYLQGNSRLEADWTTVFGKLTDVEITGRGTASFVSVNGAPSEADLRLIARDGFVGDGSAHVGDLVAEGPRINFNDVVIQGDADEVMSMRVMRDLHVSGDANEVKVGRRINEAFIGGDVNLFSTGVARNVDIVGDVNDFSAGRIMNVFVDGSTNDLNVNWGAFNSEFNGSVANGFLGGPVRNVSANGDIIFGRNEVVS